MKMNFELGMYTEIKLYYNSFDFPAMVDNPVDGERSLNKNSQFYYGFATIDNPKDFEIKTNMPVFKGRSMFDFLTKEVESEPYYWISIN